ncbi:hypothetical protein SISSUDRAFT_522307 [Sistotremastrum suecicum HHB10207 ss-3]|uniref:Uncharacterized protein n=1 Tax=Sistotremastrum suecicum HHB10207 ss-3 TaxID=1314776 RepID=A0A165XXD9_9AGAM|nr:hypothetical protein SISSUDRAFT_522307 [Sistotremastrum suecicum HHB10207 ss-3]
MDCRALFGVVIQTPLPISSSYSHLPHPTALPTVGCAHSYVVALRQRATTSVWLMRKHHNRVRHPDSPGPLMPLALPLSLPSTCPRSPPPPSQAALGWSCVRRSCFACGDLFGTGICESMPTWSMSIGMARPVLRWITCGVGPTDRNLALVPPLLPSSPLPSS